MTKFKTYIYTAIIFINITIFTSLCISTFQSILKDSVTNNGYVGNVSVVCDISEGNKISPDKFLGNIHSLDDIYIEKTQLNPGAFSGKAIYFKEDIKLKPNIISGKYFDEKTCTTDEPLAVIGKDVLKMTKKIDGETYFEYENVKYKVIGIMGYENRKSLSDLNFVINLNAYIKHTKSVLLAGNYFVGSLTNKKVTTETFVNNLKSLDKELTVKNIDNTKGLLNNLINQGINASIVLIVVIFLIFINVFNITLQWIETKKKSIGIKKALGGTNLKISLEILAEYQLVAIISYVIGTLIYAAIVKLKLISVFNADLYLLSSFITFVFSSFIALITSLFAIIRALKFPPSIIMKGGV